MSDYSDKMARELTASFYREVFIPFLFLFFVSNIIGGVLTMVLFVWLGVIE